MTRNMTSLHILEFNFIFDLSTHRNFFLYKSKEPQTSNKSNYSILILFFHCTLQEISNVRLKAKEAM